MVGAGVAVGDAAGIVVAAADVVEEEVLGVAGAGTVAEGGALVGAGGVEDAVAAGLSRKWLAFSNGSSGSFFISGAAALAFSAFSSFIIFSFSCCLFRSSNGFEVISSCSKGAAKTFMATWFCPAKKRPSPTSAERRRAFSPSER